MKADCSLGCASSRRPLSFFDYEGNKLPVNARERVVTRMHSHGRQKYPCIKWHDVAGAAAPYGAVARDPELYVWAAAEAAAVAGLMRLNS